ncbi:hypothetical protein GGR51DRAFT_570018 [Nemania sp. FL0031]|nr:hypothetical protein GGR51DRAFT_570018 [Nemania sp. FL0031]
MRFSLGNFFSRGRRKTREASTPTAAADNPQARASSFNNDACGSPNDARNITYEDEDRLEERALDNRLATGPIIQRDGDEGLYGMFIFENKDKDESGNVDIIALHGLNGHFRNTWTTTTAEGKQINWLNDLLPTVIPNARIMSYGYDSSVQFSKSTADISTFAEGLLAELMARRISAAERERPIIFVCHSLGGIVFKQALIRAHERERFTNLLKKIRGVAFFGTPHAGSSSASFGEVLASILKASTFSTNTNTKLVTALKTNSETLRNITRSFVDRSKSLQIISFYETEKMEYTNIQMVGGESAVLNLPNEAPVPINGNHRTICKFSDSPADQTRFRVVWTHLKEMVDEINSIEVPYFTELKREEQVECLRSFYHGNYESFRNRNPDRVANTCEWFLRHPEYSRWRMNESSSLLWVSADPGCGKSVLAKFLVEHLRLPKSEEARPELVCHFFFKDDNDGQRSAVLALRALLHQIFINDPAMLRHAFNPFQSKGRVIVDDFESLWGILSSIVSDPEAPNLLFILDALDECEKGSQRNLLEGLNRLYNRSTLTTNPFFKTIILSRPENNIKSSFSHNLATVRLRGEDEAEAISKDVELVVRSHINELEAEGLPRDSLLVLQKSLITRADRTFLWTTLMINLLKDAAREGVSKKDLDGLLDSRDIDAVYAHLLARSVNAARLKKLLQLVLAATRPLTLGELNVAMAVSPQQPSFNELESNLKHPMENHVKTIGGHFVRIIRSEVFLVHQTARGFLLRQQKSETSTNIGPWHLSFTMEESNSILLNCCISYLFLMAVSEDENSYATQKFFDYASFSWTKHFKYPNHNIFNEIVDICLHMCKSLSQDASQWLFAHNFILQLDNWRFANPGQQDPKLDLMLNSLILQLLRDSQVGVNATDMSGRTLLHYASAVGSPMLVEMLLNEEANPLAVDTSHNTALHYAAMNWNKAMEGKFGADQLLFVSRGQIDNTGVLTYESGINQKMTLIYPTRLNPNHPGEIANILIKKGANIDALGKGMRTPLHVATEFGWPGVVKVLLSHGADVEAKEANSRTVLHSAVEGGNSDKIMDILCKRPDLTQTDCNGDTAFKVLKRKPTMEKMVGMFFIDLL